MLRSEIVKACVWPACTTWPGETSRSTTSPLIGASTGICAERGSLRQIGGILDAKNLHPLLGGVQVCLRLVAVRFGLLQIALGDGVVLVQILGAGVVLVREAVGVRGLQIGVQQLRVVGAADLEHGLAGLDLLARN